MTHFFKSKLIRTIFENLEQLGRDKVAKAIGRSVPAGDRHILDDFTMKELDIIGAFITSFDIDRKIDRPAETISSKTFWELKYHKTVRVNGRQTNSLVTKSMPTMELAISFMHREQQSGCEFVALTHVTNTNEAYSDFARNQLSRVAA